MYSAVRLKKGRATSLHSRHPWIFSGALEKLSEPLTNGEIVSVVDADGASVATGTYSNHSMIAVRVFHFGETTLDKAWISHHLTEAHQRRILLGLGNDTTGYRVAFGECDGLPGIVIDRYDDVFVLQLATAGAEQFRGLITECLVELFAPQGIYERSDLPSRTEELLPPRTGLLYGTMPELVEFRENGRRCLADVVNGQKTGFYLDQRDLRQEIYHLARTRRTADLFSYTGACGVAALAGGASSVHFVDASEPALALCRRQAEINGIEAEKCTTESADIFQWLGARSRPEFDMILLDPPALIKSRRHLEAGRKGYHFLNRAALRLITDGGILVTSSCSAYFTEEELAVTLRRAAQQSGVTLSLLKTIRQSPDHPLSLTFPEAAYLKSFICLVRR